MNDDRGRPQVGAAVAALWEKYRGVILARLDELDHAAISVLSGELSSDARRKAERAAHKLAGSLGVYGFGKASEHALVIERLLEGDDPLSAASRLQMSERVVSLRAALESGRDHEPVDPSPDLEPALVVTSDDDLAERLETEAAGRGVRVQRIRDAESAGETLKLGGGSGVVLDLAAAPKQADVLRLVAMAGDHRTVVIVGAADSFAERIAAARRGAVAFFPRAASASEIMDGLGVKGSRDPFAGARVLVVDDDTALLGWTEAQLSNRGMTVFTESNPARFWDALGRASPDLIVLDFDMPGLNGVELCRVLRSDHKWRMVPVLFLTGRTDPVSIQAIFAAGADDYLAKSADGAELVMRIENRLGRTTAFSRPGASGAATPSAAPTRTDDHSLAPDDSGSRSVDVVVVEDDAVLAELLLHALRVQGYSTLHIADGDDAITQLAGPMRSTTARVILLDVDLPGRDGMTVLRELSRHDVLRTSRVVMLTARSTEREILMALELGARDHVAKPFSVAVLLQRIRTLLQDG